MTTNELQKINNFVIFQTEEGKVNIDVFFASETLWLSQKVMAELFDTTKQNISLHLQNIFKEGELDKNSTVKDFLTVQKEGNREVSRKVEFYNLDAIIAVGYRVNSQKATKFRIWATKILQEFIIKGFSMDDERLKQMKHFGKDYFEEMLERIREIRTSERRFYQKITDIYALSADYDKDSPVTKEFFATVQNKLHWAITGQTAVELIYSSADAKKIFMGLKTWKNAPKGKILKTDVRVAKNYLDEKHVEELNLLVSAYLDLATNNAKREIVMNMTDWVKFLTGFLEFSKYPILTHKGKISAEKARIKAESEYEKFRVIQDKNYVSDFDSEVQHFLENKSDDKNRIQVVIFDLDGLLIDSQPLQYKAYNQVFSKHGFPISLKTWHRWVQYGCNIQDCIQMDNLPLDAEIIRAEKKKIYEKLIHDELKLKPGALDLINKLYGNFRLCIASSSRIESIELSVKKFNIESKFEKLISDLDIKKGKPHPDVFLHAAEVMGVFPEGCCVIEDSVAGLKAAKSAGMKCVVCPDSFCETEISEFKSADKIVKTLNDVDRQLIEQLNKNK